MNAKLNGLAWILFGILLALLLSNKKPDWLPTLRELPDSLWGFAALACGVWGLVTALRSDH